MQVLHHVLATIVLGSSSSIRSWTNRVWVCVSYITGASNQIAEFEYYLLMPGHMTMG